MITPAAKSSNPQDPTPYRNGLNADHCDHGDGTSSPSQYAATSFADHGQTATHTPHTSHTSHTSTTPTNTPTLCGLTPEQLHERFWAARGVQVVRPGGPDNPKRLVHNAEIFLLTAPHLHTIFRLARPVEMLTWAKPKLLTIRLHDADHAGYREHALTDERGNFTRFERDYLGQSSRLGRVGLTTDPAIARAWQLAPDAHTGWRALRKNLPARLRITLPKLIGSIYDRTDAHEEMRFIRELLQVWKRPDATINRIAHNRDAKGSRAGDAVWADRNTDIHPDATFIGPCWIGAGRNVEADDSVIGPAVLWDRPDARPKTENIAWKTIEPTDAMELARTAKPRKISNLAAATKRAFDIAVSLLIILVTLPLYPIIMLAIWIEDGTPFFFAHTRETYGPRGPREFPCYKFRSMLNNAEQVKEELEAQNVADGPQFYIEHDPRHTKVGRLLRKFQLDELPQLFNILLGHMSLVGPRPSPYNENQFCPAWREARLSVRPGLTGLWQINRTRTPGKDFQEWIQYDLEYVENRCWKLDLKILWHTAMMVLHLRKK